MIGKTFLRLERDFDKHVAYCRDESTAQEFIATHDIVRDFFEVSLFTLIRTVFYYISLNQLLGKYAAYMAATVNRILFHLS